jgi:hypothetical protein
MESIAPPPSTFESSEMDEMEANDGNNKNMDNVDKPLSMKKTCLMLIQKYSIPLCLGVILGVVYANIDNDYYQYWLGGASCHHKSETPPGSDATATNGTEHSLTHYNTHSL